MSLINAVELVGPQMAPPVPGDGPIVYYMEYGPMVIVARLSDRNILAEIWSWRRGDDDWTRNWAC